jgi:hypothetical protein
VVANRDSVTIYLHVSEVADARLTFLERAFKFPDRLDGILAFMGSSNALLGALE